MGNDDNLNIKRQLERFLAGELGAADIDRLRRSFMDDPVLRGALEEYGLSRYVDGELTPDQLQHLAEHINSNPQLRTAIEEYQISRYVDGELSPDEVAELRQKIENNPELKAALDEYELLEKEIASLRSDQPPVNFQDQFHKIIDEVKHRHGKRQVD